MAGLTAQQVKAAQTGRHADGQGLYLLVSPSGTKSWVLRIQVGGTRRDFGLGSVRNVTLADARIKAADWTRIARSGEDPAKLAKAPKIVIPTFREIAFEFHRTRKNAWKNAKHRDQWINTLKTYAFPAIGDMRVSEVDAPSIEQVLLPIWLSKPETARRTRQRIATVLDYAMAKQHRSTEAPMRAVGTLLRHVKQPRKGNFPAMPYNALPAFMGTIAGSETVGRLALRMLILTAARSGEIRGARWGEVNIGAGIWTVPADRMKMGREHQVPLSGAVFELLRANTFSDANDPAALIFPGLRGNALSDMTLTKVLRSNGGVGATVHGFRSSFRDWAAENGFNNDWAEAALAHEVSNRVEAAYRRTKFLEQRRGLMADWAAFCCTFQSD